MSCPLNKLFDLEGISHQRGQINQMYSNFLIISTNLRETGGIPSATTNEYGVGAIKEGWLNSLADIMMGGSLDSERAESTGRLGHEEIVSLWDLVRR